MRSGVYPIALQIDCPENNDHLRCRFGVKCDRPGMHSSRLSALTGKRIRSLPIDTEMLKA
jgi:hypothetical protein